MREIIRDVYLDEMNEQTNEQMFSPCGNHQALLRMQFERALAIAKECAECYNETFSR